jgi:hypothetical protein
MLPVMEEMWTMLPPPVLLTAAVLRRRGCASWLRWKHDSKLVAMRDE